MAEQARVRIDPDRVTGTVDRRIFGGFIEHLGRCIYGGVFDEGSPLADERGFRTDVLDAVRRLRMPVLRWPGGNFVSGYTWTDGIGPVEERPRRIELAWHDVESNRFGTDEFIAYCREIGTEPYICVNMGTGTMVEAQAWVEYCNGTADTYWANLRRQNGHEEPFNVRYWGLGNEVHGSWQLGALSAEDYVKRAIEFAKLMTRTDPSIELIGCGLDGASDWDQTVLAGLAKYVRYHSIHIYTGADDVAENLFQPHLVEFNLRVMEAAIDRVRFNQKIDHEITVAYDEWNVWFRERGEGSALEERYTLADALAVAAYLNIFVRQCSVLGMANLAQLVNVIAPIFTSPDGLFLQTIYHPLRLMAEHTQDVALDVRYQGPMRELSSTTSSGADSRVSRIGPFEVVDVAATRASDGSTMSVSLVNRSEREPMGVAIDLAGAASIGSLKRFEVTGDDPNATNDFGQERVEVVEREEAVSGTRIDVTLPPLSHTVLRIALNG